MAKKLSLDSGWVAPILNIRSLKSFDLRITSKKDNPVKSDVTAAVEALRDQMRLIVCSSPDEVPRGGTARSEPISPKFLSCQEYEVSPGDDSDSEFELEAESSESSRRRGRNLIPGLLRRMEEMGSRYDKLYHRKQGAGGGQLAITAS